MGAILAKASGRGRFSSPTAATQHVIPDFLKFILIIAALVGAVYGGALALATYPPEQSDVIRPLPHEKLRAD
jgi:hypothetical protein